MNQVRKCPGFAWHSIDSSRGRRRMPAKNAEGNFTTGRIESVFPEFHTVGGSVATRKAGGKEL